MFFIPAVGPYYEKGFTLDEQGKIQFGTQANKYSKVMIVGCNHLCRDFSKVQGCIHENNKLCPNNKQSCTMHNGSFDCGKLSYCKGYTQRLVANTKNGTWPNTSLDVFLKILLKNDETRFEELCEYLLFINFFQRSMPHSEENRNLKFMDDNEKTEGARTFADVFKQYLPDIVITWGNQVIGGLYGQEKAVLNPELSFRYTASEKRKILPQKYQDPISYDVLEYPAKNHACLVIESYHPSGRSRYSNPETIHGSLVWAFQNLGTLLA